MSSILVNPKTVPFFVGAFVAEFKGIEYGASKFVKKYEESLPAWVVNYGPTIVAGLATAVTAWFVTKYLPTTDSKELASVEEWAAKLTKKDITELARAHDLRVLPNPHSIPDLTEGTKAFGATVHRYVVLANKAENAKDLVTAINKELDGVAVIGGSPEDGFFLNFKFID